MLTILMQNRVDVFEHPGGDTVAMLRLQHHLVRMGARVEVSLELNPDCARYDVVSLFNIMRVHETYAQFRNAKRQGKRIVVMPIYWDFAELDRKGRHPLVGGLKKALGQNGFEWLKNMVRLAQDPRQRKTLGDQLRRPYTRQQREVVTQADAVTPNSHMEADILKRQVGAFACRVVYNGVEPETFLGGDGRRFRQKWGISYDRFGLCIGRFDARKNQAGLIRALREERIPLVFIGDPGPHHHRYFTRCQAEARTLPVAFLPHMDHAELADACAAAHMHIQPSWLETPGLTSLEAGLAGCNLVLSDRGSVREYFEDAAWYCDPENLPSIRRAVRAAFAAPRGAYAGLRSRLRDHFTWERSARSMLAVYEELVGSRMASGRG